MNRLIDMLVRLPVVDGLVYLALALVAAWALLVLFLLRKKRVTIDRNWAKVYGSDGRTIGVVRPIGYLVPDEPKTLEGRRLPTPRYRGKR